MRLEARGVAYQYGNGSPRILEDFDFEMEHTERVGIMAPSGYGKTTLCKLLSGYLKPERGQVLLDGRPLSQENWMNRFPTELSGGELQRFCIARALGKRTRFLLADEISTMLDLITQSQIWDFLVKEVGRRQIGLIVVSHNKPLLDHVCTRIANLSKTAYNK